MLVWTYYLCIYTLRTNAKRGDILDVRLGNIRIKMFKIADRQLQTPILRKHVETFIIGQPTANTDARFKTFKRRTWETVRRLISVLSACFQSPQNARKRKRRRAEPNAVLHRLNLKKNIKQHSKKRKRQTQARKNTPSKQNKS